MSENNLYNEHYEKLHSCNALTDKEKQRIKEIISYIPDNVNSVLEVGCGDGRIINDLIGKYERICGLDISLEGLEKVKADKVQGSVDDLPFPDNSFDLVICSEVLEHLPYSIYQKAIKEIMRVTRKYILISVPNNEDIEILKVNCPQCGCSFHPYRHLRTYDVENLRSLFPGYNLTTYKKIILPEQKTYPSHLIKLLRILKVIKPQYPEHALCPQCGFSSPPDKTNKYPKKHEQSASHDILDLLKSERRGGWILGLYTKN